MSRDLYDFRDEYGDYISREEKSDLEYLYLTGIGDLFGNHESKEADKWLHFYKTFDFKLLKKVAFEIGNEQKEFCFTIPEFKVVQIEINFPCAIEYSHDNVEKQSKTVEPKFKDGCFEVRGWRYFKYISHEHPEFCVLTNLSVSVKALTQDIIPKRITIGLF